MLLARSVRAVIGSGGARGRLSPICAANSGVCATASGPAAGRDSGGSAGAGPPPVPTSTTMRLRALRTLNGTAALKRTRIRADRPPSGVIASSSVTPATWPNRDCTLLMAPTLRAFRRSMSSVKGSGWLIRYATGSDASMVSVVEVSPSVADTARSCGPIGVGAASTAARDRSPTAPPPS